MDTLCLLFLDPKIKGLGSNIQGMHIIAIRVKIYVIYNYNSGSFGNIGVLGLSNGFNT